MILDLKNKLFMEISFDTLILSNLVALQKKAYLAINLRHDIVWHWTILIVMRCFNVLLKNYFVITKYNFASLIGTKESKWANLFFCTLSVTSQWKWYACKIPINKLIKIGVFNSFLFKKDWSNCLLPLHVRQVPLNLASINHHVNKLSIISGKNTRVFRVIKRDSYLDGANSHILWVVNRYVIWIHPLIT